MLTEKYMMCPKCNQKLFLEFPKNNEWHYTDYYKCPECCSHNRQRVLYKLLKDRDNGKLLEYSPAKILQEFHTMTADFPPRENKVSGVIMADVLDDLTQSQFKDNEFDTVICSHILDAIPDEEKAIKELHRITKHTAFVACPMFDIEKTVEYGELLPGNYNHYRRPGKDYKERFSIFKSVEELTEDGEYILICRK
jgi:SAM-dependent methyltransferase